ncbi:acyltransferase [Rufibacter sp. XAAS-G3-1]|uniref:acyltransferase family protein n=1 Tax=Rufibacter sp. XAAS-G3-1 TaxID=2729134 RepID=UPI0015E63116|nr:acyltransferase [Rufibacter sp. XAAS-G3-1]
MIKQLPGLNAIRAIAAITVLLAHINQSISLFSQHFNDSHSHYDSAGYAVTIFFVLSGFLITLILLNEKKHNGIINIKHFYLKRILRIWPLYFLIICITIFISYLSPAFYWSSNNSSYIYYLLFIGNVAYVTNNIISPIVTFWSISVEEQFYLFWPLLISRKKIIKVLFGFLIIFSIIKIGLRVLDNSYAYWLITETRFSCMAIGGIGAYIHVNKNKYLNVIYHPASQIISWIFFTSVLLYKPVNIASIFNHEIYSLFFLIVIINLSTNIKIPYMIFNNLIFDYLGKISYGIYCWHALIIILLSSYIRSFNLVDQWHNLAIIYILVITITIAASHVSYFYFENKFLLMKNKFISSK